MSHYNGAPWERSSSVVALKCPQSGAADKLCIVVVSSVWGIFLRVELNWKSHERSEHCFSLNPETALLRGGDVRVEVEPRRCPW